MNQCSLEFFIPPESIASFEAELKAKREEFGESNLGIKRFNVTGQSLDAATLDLVKVVVALGGGVGISAILKGLAQIVVDFQKAKRGKVNVKTSNGITSLENYTAEDVQKILAELSKEKRSQ